MRTPTTLIKNISSLVTVNAEGAPAKAGKEMNSISELANAAIMFDDTIQWIGSTFEAEEKLDDVEFLVDQVIDCDGKTIIPGFVDSHTHIVFAGNRSDEFARRLRGVSYQQIASEGGGILATMTAVRDATITELAKNAMPLILNAMHHGTTTMEIKSGYGLDVKSELKQLRAIKILQQELPIELVPTFLGAHAFPPEYKENREEYIRIICEEMIPQVADEKLAVYCDVFTETGYFSIAESEHILKSALDAGLKLKIHGNEFTNLGAVKMAATLGATSIDHLIQANDEDVEIMKGTGLVAGLLPGTSFFLNEDYAPARKFIDNDVIVAIATDCNPGSCFCENMQMIISIACLQMGMTMEEAITAATLNGAHSVGRADKYGSLEVGKKANFSLVNAERYTEMMYHYGSNHIREVWVNGKREIVNYG